MKGLKENPWKKIQFISTNCNLHENMIETSFFYIKRERKKKKLILKCIWPILSKNSYKLKHECFFSTLEGRFLKLQFVTPKLASFQNFQSSTGTKTRLVLGSGQPRQRVMKTFPSFFFFFFFCTETTITNDPVACNEGPRRVTTETSCRYPFVSFRGCTTSAISLQTRFHRANNNYAPPMYRPTMLTGNAHPIKLPRSRRTPTTWMAVSPSPKPWTQAINGLDDREWSSVCGSWLRARWFWLVIPGRYLRG